MGILVFGSVARGEVDRKSDIDLFVLVNGDRTVARRVLSTVASDFGEKRFDGDRYTFEPFVESRESVQRAGEKLHSIFDEGITVYGDDEFQQIRKQVMPMSSTRIETLMDEVQASFDRRPDEIEVGLETNEADLLQLRKSYRLLAGATTFLDQGFHTLVIEASFVAIERVVEFKLLESGMEPRDLSGTHPGVYTEAARRGILSEHVAQNLQDLWRNHRAKTYYQDGLAARERATKLYALASETHEYVVNQSSKRHECICG